MVKIEEDGMKVSRDNYILVQKIYNTSYLDNTNTCIERTIAWFPHFWVGLIMSKNSKLIQLKKYQGKKVLALRNQKLQLMT